MPGYSLRWHAFVNEAGSVLAEAPAKSIERTICARSAASRRIVSSMALARSRDG